MSGYPATTKSERGNAMGLVLFLGSGLSCLFWAGLAIFAHKKLKGL
jgi:hypothetical protein